MTARATRVACTTLATLAVLATGCSDTPSPMADDVHGAHVAAGAAVAAGAPAPTRHTGPQGGFGQFVIECGYSHSAPDDPIVHPAMPGMSHRHDFFGNTDTDAFSTTESLLDADDTTCQNRADTAAYWAPTLLDGGEPVTPRTSAAYYRVAPGVELSAVEPFPQGLMVVAGDLTATADDPQPVDLAGWGCGVSTRLSTTPPNCPASAPLRGVVTFPDCWDGVRLDSADHRSHMANSAHGACPPTHPVHVPQLTFAITYPITGTDHDLTLASGSTHGFHSDFVNAWDQEHLTEKVEVCLHRDAVCGLSSNRSEDPLFSG